MLEPSVVEALVNNIKIMGSSNGAHLVKLSQLA
jgi:hypothetical protein